MATLTPAARNGITGVMPLRMRKLQLARLVREDLAALDELYLGLGLVMALATG